MNHEYVINGYTNTITLTGAFSTYPEINYGQETTFEFFLQGDNTAPEYQTLKEYQSVAGRADVNETLGDVYYHSGSEFTDTAIETLVVEVVPGDGINQARGVWGIISDIEDNTERFESIGRLDVSVTVLADATEFDTHNDVIDEFATGLTSDRRLLP